MRTARAKGLRERVVVLRHGLKNSLIPVVTVLGLQMAGLLGGALIIEQIFTLPGLGQYTFQELFNKDFHGRPDDDALHRRDRHLAQPGGRCELRVVRPAHPVLVRH